MNKKILSVILAATMLLSACSGGNNSAPSENPQDNAPSVKKNISFDEVYKDIPEENYVMIFEPLSTSKIKMELGMDIPEGFDADWLSEEPNTENFEIIHLEDKKSYAFAKFYTAPANLAEFYGTDDKDKILDEMQSIYFPVMDVHDGLLKNSTEDFGYRLITDWTGKFHDDDFYFIEFADDEKGIHSMRFMTGNSKIDENYWSFEFKADIPSDNTQLIEQYRSILLSLSKKQ